MRRHIARPVEGARKLEVRIREVLLYQACFHGTSLHLTELTDDVSLCSYLVEYTYLSAFYKTIIIVMIKTVVIMVILFECVVAIMWLVHPGIIIVTALSDL